MALVAPSLHIISESSMLVSWSAVVGAVGYAVVVYDGDAKCAEVIASESGDTFLVVGGLKADVAYRARVASINGRTWSPYSPFSATLKLPKLIAPEAPLMQIVSPSSVLISWPAVPGADLYSVSVLLDNGETKHVDWSSNSLLSEATGAEVGSDTFVVVEGLKADVVYRAKVACIHGSTWSPYSPFSFPLRLPKLIAPREPSLQMVGPSSLLVSWTAVPSANFYGVVLDDEEARYVVDWETQTLFTEAPGSKFGSSTFVVVKGLKTDVAYKAKVACSVQGSTWSPFSPFSSILKLPKVIAPQSPSLQIVSPSSLLVSWSAIPGAERYAVCFEDNGEKKFVDSPTGSLCPEAKGSRSGNETFVVIESLRMDGAYKAKVSSRHGNIWSPYSAYSPVIQLSMVPQPPNLEILNNSTLVVSWLEFPNATGYDIIVHDGRVNYLNWQTNSLQSSPEDTHAGKSTSVVINGLAAGVSYKAKVVAHLVGEFSKESGYGKSVHLSTGASGEGSSKRNRAQECTVCFAKPSDVAFDPCGHLCTCSECAALLTECPICRGHVNKKLRIYGIHDD